MKVLYIMGRGRSGSTVLANVLGEIPGFFSAGEIRYLWDPVVVNGSTCGCGEHIRSCPVWSPVLDAMSDVDIDQVVRWQHEIVKESNIFRLLRCRNGCGWEALEGYVVVMSRLYKAIQQVTGCSVIVDSSKRPSYAAFITMLESCEPFFIHLSRDPRASAHSWKSRKYASAHGGEVKRRNALDSTVRWDLLSLGAEALLRRVPATHRMHLRFEDFAAAPRPVTEQICELLGTGLDGLPFVDERTVTLGTNHTIAGNPSRFRTGRLVIEDTAEWKTSQDPLSKWTATLVALPFLRRYGYSMRPQN